MMTAADLLIMCKDWNTQKEGTEQLYREFHLQGDLEKANGSEPIPMMDRDQIHELPKNQVGFMKFVCLPVYETLSHIFPDFRPLQVACGDNMEQWQRVLDGKSTNLWEPSKSWPKPVKVKLKNISYKEEDSIGDDDST